MLHAMTENVLLEIQKTFDFFKATAASDRIDRILLSGGASRVDGFAEALDERFGAPVETFDPFQTIAFDAAKLGVDGRGEPRADVGGRGRPRAPKGGRPMIRINLLAVERDAAKKKARRFQAGPEADDRLQRSSSIVTRCVRRLALLVAAQRVGAARRATSPRRSRKRRACTRSFSRCSSSSSARRSCSSASR